MFCLKCGSEIADGSTFCPNCGQTLGKSAQQGPEHMQAGQSYAQQNAGSYSQYGNGQQTPGSYGQSGYNQYGNGQQNFDPYGQPQKKNGLAIAGFVLSLVSLLLNPFSLISALGIILSCVGMGQINHGQGDGKGLATAGVVIGIINTVLYWIMLIACASSFYYY